VEQRYAEGWPEVTPEEAQAAVAMARRVRDEVVPLLDDFLGSGAR